MTELLNETGAALAYTGIGLVLLVVGYVLVDLLTPGKLSTLIYEHRNRNAAILVTSGFLSVTMIAVTAIVTSDDDLGRGLLDTAVFGGIGLLLQALAFVVVDKLTPGDLGVICTEERAHPAVWVTAVGHVAVGAIVAAAIS